MKTNINFKIKGTKLPDMEGISYKCCSWGDADEYRNLSRGDVLVSYGYTKHNGIIHILADKPDYKGDNYLMFKESDVIKAAKKQGMIKEEFVLPEKWCIKVTKENSDAVIKWRTAGSCSLGGYCVNKVPFSDVIGYWYENKPKDCTEITFEQFKKYVLIIKQEEVMKKEIIGYKLKKDCQQYLEAAEKISGHNPNFDLSLEHFLEKSHWGNFKERLEKAGVLDLWFEPVFKEEYKYKVGDWVLTSDDANGWGSSSGEINHKILQISKIDYDDLVTHGGKYYFGTKKTAGKEILRLATPEEIKKATTNKEFSIGDYKAVVKDGNIIIDGKGKISVEAFNDFYDSYLHNTFTAIDNYDISLTVATIKIGCVKNVTLEQTRELYNYTKTL